MNSSVVCFYNIWYISSDKMLFRLFITFSADRNNLNTLLILVREFDKYFDEMQSLMFSIIAWFPK